MHALNGDLRESGEFVEVRGLTSPDRGKLVRAGKDGTPITDGIFPESKEFLAGYEPLPPGNALVALGGSQCCQFRPFS